jgi:hypothetical protein
MKNNSIKLLIIQLLSASLFFNLQAQNTHQTISSASATVKVIGGSVAFTIGQLSCITVSNSSGSIAVGIQQPFEIEVIDALPEIKAIDLSANMFPNPTSNSLMLKIDGFYLEDKNLYLQLFDLNGKLMKNAKISAIETLVDMISYPSSIYVFKIVDTGTNEGELSKNQQLVLKTFKIIKN